MKLSLPVKPTAILKSAALAAGLSILLIGVVLAQTATPPSPATPPAVTAPATPPAATSPEARRSGAPTMSRREVMDACRTEVGRDVRGSERREAMRKCVEAKRESAGLNQREDRRGQHANRGRGQGERRALMTECRNEFKDQRLTEAERRDSIQGCIAKKDPRAAKAMECRKQANEKKLERGSREFRQHMRSCNQRG